MGQADHPDDGEYRQCYVAGVAKPEPMYATKVHRRDPKVVPPAPFGAAASRSPAASRMNKRRECAGERRGR